MHLHGVRALLQAGADAGELVGLLVDLGREAALVQRRRHRQSADAGADDRDAHDVSGDAGPLAAPIWTVANAPGQRGNAGQLRAATLPSLAGFQYSLLNRIRGEGT